MAIATPPGRGGLGIVRLSGSQAVEFAHRLVQPGVVFSSWAPVRAQLLDADGSVMDDVIVTFFEHPRSYTTEDVIEIACHGSPVVLRRCIERALACGARLAEPGEFTLRAFLHGRIDLTQAEAVRDLIDATTLHQARVAARQASGALARAVRPVKTQLLDLIALLEAGIDFAEDDISVASPEQLQDRLHPILQDAARLADSFAYGQVLREGFSMAFVGQPNVGKSSLFNRLLAQDRAIVTDQPGTTRDLVSEVTAIEGIPVRLVDTAGIRNGESLAETLGIDRSYRAMADADLTLVILDSSKPRNDSDSDLIERAKGMGRFLVVANKCDLGNIPEPDVIAVSAETGEGIEGLRASIVEAIAPGGVLEQSGAVITSLRQQSALEIAIAAFRKAGAAIEESIPHEMLLLDLYDGLAALDELTGKTTADDILNRIFSTFCIGK